MRFIRNEIQTPKRLLLPEKRENLTFFILVAGVAVLTVGVVGFLYGVMFRDFIEARGDLLYRDVQK